MMPLIIKLMVPDFNASNTDRTQ